MSSDAEIGRVMQKCQNGRRGRLKWNSRGRRRIATHSVGVTRRVQGLVAHGVGGHEAAGPASLRAAAKPASMSRSSSSSTGLTRCAAKPLARGDHHVHASAVPCQRHERGHFHARQFPHLSGGRPPIQTRQSDVEQHHVGPEGGSRLDGCRPRRHRLAGVAPMPINRHRDSRRLCGLPRPARAAEAGAFGP